MKRIKVLAYLFGFSYMLIACNSVEKSVDIKGNIGYFVSDFNENVDYDCENKRQRMTDGGKFECASFPISFYMDNMKIGEISSIHEDGYVYPQDIILLEDTVPVYTSEGNMKFLFIE